ncbi:hypothetical protein PR202_gb22277 [Eleusine coracana subsp. coracana]|uniref:Uncharacterized protein n=1 Tax=Eleusine coracana subsp. coracana TaxID=191504 RepID=A0AAV5FF96_ELECO|nr:hypothetical protein QOZ80_6AG0539160 [Eleusine coracana subsp. coracana]GJN33656.1 hypothetical protein PR202_gb22277 [Eleusine coracana subsp. coracana]
MFCECGTGSFKHVDNEDPGLGGGSPKGRKKRGGKVNPYAERGLDRFSMVVSELESRRAKILRRVGSDTGLVMIRFVQSNKQGGWAPVIVKLPEEPSIKDQAVQPTASTISTTPDQASPREGGANKVKAESLLPARRRASFSRATMRRPSRYWPSIIVLTLVSLSVFGRLFAVCLVSIWWYLLPTMTVGSGSFLEFKGQRFFTSSSNNGAGLKRTLEKMGSSCGVDHEVVSSPRSHAR